MRAAGAHLGPVGWQPAHFQTFPHPHIGQKLSQQQHTLSPEACDLNTEFAEMMVRARGLGLLALLLYCSAFEQLQPRCLCGGGLSGGNFDFAGRGKRSTGKFGIIVVRVPICRASTGPLPQMVGQGERISTNEKPASVALKSPAPLRTARRALIMFLLSDRATRSM